MGPLAPSRSSGTKERTYGAAHADGRETRRAAPLRSRGGGRLSKAEARADPPRFWSGIARQDEIAENLSVSTSTVFRTNRRFVEEGLAASLSEHPVLARIACWLRRKRRCVIATACSAPPGGRARRRLLSEPRLTEKGADA